MDLPIRSPNSVVAVFSFNVGVVLDVSENIQAASGAGFCKRFSNRINAATLWPAYYPSKVVFFSQAYYLLTNRDRVLGY
jgi:hypothetical protein